jgi:hypothetical protein
MEDQIKMEKETVRSIILAAAIITLFCSGIFSQSSAGLEHETDFKFITSSFASAKNTLNAEQVSKIINSVSLSVLMQKKYFVISLLNNKRPQLKIGIPQIKFSRVYIPQKKILSAPKILF